MRSSWSSALILVAPLAAQTNHAEVEPNDDKAGANLLPCLAAGDAVTGNSTGAATTVPGADSADTFRIATCAEPQVLLRHRLTLASAVAGHTCTLRGLDQSGTIGIGGTLGTADDVVQTALPFSVPPRYVQWYSGGAGGELYYRVAGSASTTADYVADYTSTPVAPAVVPGAFLPGTLTISSIGSTSTDTDFWVYDANLDALPGFGNDDNGPNGNGLQSRIVRTFSAGTYHVAMGNFDLANEQAGAADEDNLFGNVTDFPRVAASNATSTNSSCAFTITDGAGTVPVAATRASAFDVVWVRFTVGTTAAFEAFCTGDGTLADHTTPCPCGNDGAPGNGCASSVNPSGANLTATGSAPLDDVVLHGSGMPATVACIYLQGTALEDAPFGDGTRCAGGTLLRLRTKVNVGGASAFPDSTDTVTLSQRGGVAVGSGERRLYQTYYRNAAAVFCPPETFNVTNGWTIDW